MVWVASLHTDRVDLMVVEEEDLMALLVSTGLSPQTLVLSPARQPLYSLCTGYIQVTPCNPYQEEMKKQPIVIWTMSTWGWSWTKKKEVICYGMFHIIKMILFFCLQKGELFCLLHYSTTQKQYLFASLFTWVLKSPPPDSFYAWFNRKNSNNMSGYHSQKKEKFPSAARKDKDTADPFFS